MYLERNILSNEVRDAYIFLDENLSVRDRISYSELIEVVDDLSEKLPNSSSPVLLVYEDVKEFIITFLAFQKIGITTIPMFFPKNKRHFERLKDIIFDSKCEIILCEEKNKSKISKGLEISETKFLNLISLTDIIERKKIDQKRQDENIVFIQYTSGSTSSPKGVIITKENLAMNQKMIQNLFGCNEDSVILSWLPFYHDMGLIGSILHSLFVGATCVIMPSSVAVQSPFKWLDSISKFKVTHSGGPNFIYDLCVNQIDDNRLQELDLSSWKVAYNGSEPIRNSTIVSFIKKFQKSDFDANAYYTCYGLAEATLLVSGGKYIQEIGYTASSGKICDEIEVCVYNSETGEINISNGEIVLHGKSVTTGYWNNENSDLFIELDDKKFLRTGDIGSIVNNELIITGRSKEIIIINGKNYFPYEIENIIAESVLSIDKNGVIVSFIENENIEKPIVFAEIKKAELSNLNPNQVINEIDRLIIELVGIETFDVLLLTPRKLARTSSGKLQRVKTKESYIEQNLEFLFSKRNKLDLFRSTENVWIDSILKDNNCNNVEKYLITTLNNKLKISLSEDDFNQNLLDLGIDSLKSVNIINTINQDLELNIDVSTLMNLKTTVDLEQFLQNLVWMKTTESNGEEITI